ncbi:hypothetical protein ABB37_04810 [Leptomonas pyrrhocoris]|uniref:C2H2-type domain-containing protein n=1 Tax=Leptomonas pyrrhocoris TaxID=157538 RepID=A0A0N0DVN3_LEPPY|nr:hypothetical protein ABB37_04810 [Leptomonas pyrrhocoris]KPA80614.1 hypothetical protein ABB37_04810 [Leptomonas pyrrhocoris]|eukprot:XP_015659053.1 hypothetical protein ABB37_04810 [Leptomonas pyrrhocoris]
MTLNASYSNMRSSQDRGFSTRNASSANEVTARCKHCSKVMPAESMEEHEAFFCPLKPVWCQHIKANGDVCGFVCSGADALRDHYKTCKDHPRKRRAGATREGGSPRGAPDRGVELCEDCQRVFSDRASLMEHQRICPLKNVSCPLHCGLWMQRSQVPDHILHTAIKHKPLHRPSATNYGGDNIHMVVAVLMEALQNAKKAQQQQKLLYEETMSNLGASRSFSHASLRRSIASVEDAPVMEVGSLKSQNSTSPRVAGSVESNGLLADIAASASCGSSEERMHKADGTAEGHDDDNDASKSLSGPQLAALHNQGAAPPVNAMKAATSAEAVGMAPPPLSHCAMRHRKLKTPRGAKGRRNTSAAKMAPGPSPAKTSLRTSLSAAACPPSTVRYEDFVMRAPVPAVRVKSPLCVVRLRPSCARPPASPLVAPPANEAELSPHPQLSESPMAVSPRVNGTDAGS